MKVLQLISSNGFFGAERVMMELSNQLTSSKYLPFLGIISKASNSYLEIESEAKKKHLKIEIFQCKGKLDLKTISQIRRFIKHNRIDIIHTHGYKSNVYSLIATFNLNVKRIVTCHNWLGNEKKMRIYKNLDKFFLRGFGKVITVSDELMAEILQGGISKDKVMVINNGVDIEKFQATGHRPQVKKSLGLREDDRVIGTIGRLTLEKGHIYLLKAFAKVILEFPNIKLLIVGDGPLKEALQATSCRLQLKDKVIFAGMRDDIPEILSIMDVFVLPSLTEGMPMALLEAMAARRAIIASKVGAIIKIIEHGVTGLIIEPADVSSMRDFIALLLQDTEKAKFLSEKAYEKVKSEFSARKMAEQYIQAYSSLQHIKNNKNFNKNGKILQIEIAGKGGICHYTYNLTQEISKFIKTTLVTSFDYELKNKEINFALVEIFNRFKTNPLIIFKLIKIFKDKEINVIHFQLSQHPFFVLLLCYMVKIFTNKNIVITAHNGMSHEVRKWEKNIYKSLYASADKVIVHAQANKLEMIQHFAIAADKISIIPHGNYLFFNEGKIKENIPENAFNILFFGYIRKYKGLIYLIRALNLVKQEIPKVKLFIVGKSVEDFTEYQKEIDSLGLQKNVEINLDYIPFDQAEKYFYKANVIVLPYLNIYQSGVLQLAYGFGKPVVTTNVGGLQEVVENWRSGFIVPPGDVNALSEKIIAILNSRGLQQEMGNYALHLAKTKFSWDSIAVKTLELYKSILN